MEWIFAAIIVAGVVWFLASIFKTEKGFSPFIAARYLKPERTFISIITLISIAGVSLGVLVMTVVMAVFTGFGERVKEIILGFEPHLVVDSRGILENWQDPYEKIKTLEGVTSVSPYVRGQVIMDFNGLRSAPMVRGILPPEGAEKVLMESKIYDPKGKPKGFVTDGGEFFLDIDTAVVGDGIARNQGIQVGDTIIVYSPKETMEIAKVIDEANNAASEEERKSKMDEIQDVTAPMELTVTGIFDSGHYEFDNNVVFTHLETAQILYNFGLDTAHGIAVRGEDAFQVANYEQQIAKLFGGEASSEKRGVSREWQRNKVLGMIFLAIAWIILLPMALKYKEKQFWIGMWGCLIGIAVLAVISVPGPPIFEMVGSELRVMPWTVMHKGIFDAIAIERQMMYLIVFIIMVVSAFCIMNTTITTTVQKRGEIGLLKALGAQESQIATIFLSQGVLVGILGIVIGQVFGQLIIHFRNELGALLGKYFGVNFFNESIYGIGELPSAQTLGSVVMICGASLLVSILAALLPAMMASMEEPAKALRSD